MASADGMAAQQHVVKLVDVGPFKAEVVPHEKALPEEVGGEHRESTEDAANEEEDARDEGDRGKKNE